MRLAALTRRKMVDTLRAVGPDAPTLCEGWDAADLAAHLVVRDRRIDGLPGIALKPFAQHTQTLMNGVKALPWETVLERVAAGPRWTPFAIPPVNELVNPVEFAVHREDARRGRPGFVSEAPEPELADALWKALRRQRGVMTRKAPAKLQLRTPDGRTAGPSEAELSITGNPLELLLFCFGRQQAAEVEVLGPTELIEQLMSAPLGL